MKIGILTYTREYANLGTVMQCYCTLKAVQNAYPGAHIELIDYATAKPARRPYLSDISLESMANDWIRIRKYDHFFDQALIFSKGSLRTSNVNRALQFIARQQYDVIYVGADTVLELKGARANGLTPYWLNRQTPGTKILAAASALNITPEALSARQRFLMEQSIDSFALLGVRDHATFRLLSAFTGAGDRRLQLIPDPTFTYDIDYGHVRRYLDQRRPWPSAPMVCLHLLRDTAWAPRLAALFREAGYVVASLRPAHYADLILNDLSPFEQLGIYKEFSLVITHRFHDTVFCLKNLTPVLAFPEYASDITPRGESKVATLLRSFDADDASYVPNDARLSADYLFERFPGAIAHFRQNRMKLQGLLAQHRATYTGFIQQSAAVVR